MKYVRITCRPKDPDRYSGVFRIKKKYQFKHRGNTETEMQLEDNRIVKIKPIGNRIRYIVYKPDCTEARDHKIKDLTILPARHAAASG